MRGALGIASVNIEHAGIIPAYAGSTAGDIVTVTATRNHPRVCGEHLFMAIEMSMSRGSSPRMRGAPAGYGSYRGHAGIIPAYAGSTNVLDLSSAWVGDHPRVCGEHGLGARLHRNVWGSSPRMRGALGAALSVMFSRGIIPAYAGSTAPSPRRPRARGDHPRVCGEHCGVVP